MLVPTCSPIFTHRTARGIFRFEWLFGYLFNLTPLPLQAAAAVNSTRWALYHQLKAMDLPIEVASGGRTKFNRRRLEIPKDHCLDAACVGAVDAIDRWKQPVLSIKATGRGSYQRTRLNRYGFPRGYLMRQKSVQGLPTGDIVKAVVTKGKKMGTYMVA